MTTPLVDRITEYLSLGGLVNPEAMDHDKVRDLLIDCRSELAAARAKSIPQDIEPLMRFYAVDSLPALIRIQEQHIARLQAKVPPLKDEQPGHIRK